MNLLEHIRLRDVMSDAQPDWFEYTVGLSPITNQHPPSLSNPQRVKVPTAQEGWRKGDSQKQRDQAKRDLLQIQNKMNRQIGKPAIARTALWNPDLYR
jgi:hypothetical protein